MTTDAVLHIARGSADAVAKWVNDSNAHYKNSVFWRFFVPQCWVVWETTHTIHGVYCSDWELYDGKPTEHWDDWLNLAWLQTPANRDPISPYRSGGSPRSCVISSHLSQGESSLTVNVLHIQCLARRCVYHLRQLRSLTTDSIGSGALTYTGILRSLNLPYQCLQTCAPYCMSWMRVTRIENSWHKMAATALIVELFSKWRHCHRMHSRLNNCNSMLYQIQVNTTVTKSFPHL